MMILFFLILIKFSLNQFLLHVLNIYISNINYIENNFSINLEINIKNFSNNIIVKDTFKIILESDKEINKKIIFSCDLFILDNSYIQCSLKKKYQKIQGIFSFRLEYFRKCFIIKHKSETLFFTLDILEEEFFMAMIKYFSTINNLFNVKFDYKISNIRIPIAMALDNGYIYTTIVAITSMMENSNSNTHYDYYIMHPSEFSMENKKKIKSLEDKYNRCSIKFINMTDQYKSAKTVRYLTTPAYYRLSLSDLLPNIDKIIYLDGDTLIFCDLKLMYDINMKNYYYKGFLDINKDPFHPKNTLYLCSGVLLINLEELRKDDMVNKMHKFMKDNEKRLKKIMFHDQAIINAVCYKKMGILPANFGVFNFKNIKHLKKFYKKYRYKYKYSISKLKSAFRNPLILHFTVNKPWKIRRNYHSNLWWNYAKKTDYYNEICNQYPKTCNNKKK